MDIFTPLGTYTIKDSESPLIYMNVEFSKNGRGNGFKRMRAMVDSGSSKVLIPEALAEELGIKSKDITAISESGSAGGEVIEPQLLCDLRLRCLPSNQTVLLAGIEVCVSATCEEILLGQNLLRYFNVGIKSGQLIYFEFDEKLISTETR